MFDESAGIENDKENHPVSQKIIGSYDVSEQSSMLAVKLQDASDVASIGYDAVPVFVSSPGKEELERKFGLDRWFEVTVPEDRNTDEVAENLASLEVVSTVEFIGMAKRASDLKTVPYCPAPVTKGAGSPLFNDPFFASQWHYVNNGDKGIAPTAYAGADINVKDVWTELTTGDPSIIVAVVDEGVMYSHPDLAGNMWVNERELNGAAGVDDDGNGYVDDVYGYNFVTNGPVSWGLPGDSGHGTHCAGTISAVNNNSVGVCGVAGGNGSGNGVRIMSCQIFSGESGGTPTMSARAIKYAADMGASVISCSWGFDAGVYMSDDEYRKGNSGTNSLVHDAIKYFESVRNNDVVDGGIAIFASGNDGKPYSNYPGALNDIICVSAFGPDYLPAQYTNYGPGCNIVGPGGDRYIPPYNVEAMVLSTLPYENSDGSGYGYMHGTSMACPHVSGVTALALSYAKALGRHFGREDFKDMIVTSANDFDSRLTGIKETYYGPMNLSDYQKNMGTGAIDAWRLMMKIEGIPCLVATIGKRQWLDLSDYFGTASVSLTYLGLEISDEDRNELGLVEEPEIKYGRLYIHPTKLGSGKIRIYAVGGGEAVGGGDKPIGGMEISQEISIISRSFKSSNGGWL